MKKNLRKLLSLMLCLTLCLSLFPAGTAWAEEPEAATEPAEEGEKGPAAEAVQEEAVQEKAEPQDAQTQEETTVIGSGTCGENLTWVMSSDQTLTISGTGPMDDFSSSPWRTYSDFTVVIENGVTSIGDCAFAWSWAGGSITIPESVTSIGKEAFRGCSSLTEITLPGSVTTIGEYAFCYCGMESISIPGSVTSIGNGAFESPSLKEITVSADNPAYCAVDGVLFNKDMTRLLCYPPKREAESYTIPESVAVLCESAFTGCRYLTELTIGSNVSEIEDAAIWSNDYLTAIHVSADNGVYASDGGVLFSKDKTTLLLYPAGREGSYIIPDGVNVIADGAFNCCENMTDVTIPDGVTCIGNGAFSDCYSLTTVAIPESVESIGGGAFVRCTGLTSITIPEQVTRIEGCTFMDCGKLTSVGLPEGLTFIGDSAFMNCALTEINIPEGVTAIEGWAFYGCNKLTEIVIPEGITAIEEATFGFCEGVTSVTIPAAVTSIGGEAFTCCTSLQEINFAGDAPAIAGNAFINVTANAYYPAGNETWTEEVMQNYSGSLTWASSAEKPKTFKVGETKEDDGTGNSYSFSPTTDGFYSFIGHAGTDTHMFLCVEDSSGERIASFDMEREDPFRDGSCCFEAKAGETYDLYAANYWGVFGLSDSITLELREAVQATGIKTGGGDSGGIGQTFYLYMRFEPLNAVPEEYTWSSGDPAVATVDQNGQVECLSAGSAYITVTSDSGLTASQKISVYPAESMKFKCQSRTGYIGLEDVVSFEFEPYGTKEHVEITSSDPTVAELSYDEDRDIWSVSYLALGTATLTATSASGLTDTCTVTVKEKEEFHTGDIVTVTVQPDDQLYYTFTPAESGEYAFCSEEGTGYFRCNVDSPFYNSGKDIMEFTGGETYTLTVWNDTAAAQTYTLRLEKTVPVERVEIVLTSWVKEPYVGNELTFRAYTYPAWARDETWSWSIDNEEAASLSSSGMYGYVDLNAPGTVTVTVTMESGATDSLTFEVIQPEEIQCGDSRTVTLSYEETVKYSFTPTESGDYVFYRPVTEGIYYEEEQYWYFKELSFGIQHNGTSEGTRLWFYSGYDAVVCTMQAGETYVLYASHYVTECQQEQVSGTLYFDRMKEPESISITGVPELIWPGDYLSLECISAGEPPFITQNVTWTVGDESIIALENNRNGQAGFSVLAAGETTITAALDNGLSASCVVYVVESPFDQFTVSSFAELKALVSEERTKYAIFTYTGDETFVFEEDLTLPENTQFDANGDIRIPSGVTVTTNGYLSCPDSTLYVEGTLIAYKGIDLQNINVSGRLEAYASINIPNTGTITGEENIVFCEGAYTTGTFRIGYDVSSIDQLKAAIQEADTNKPNRHYSIMLSGEDTFTIEEELALGANSDLILSCPFIIAESGTFSVSGNLAVLQAVTINGSLINTGGIRIQCWEGSSSSLTLGETGSYSGTGEIVVRGVVLSSPDEALPGFDMTEFEMVEEGEGYWTLTLKTAEETIPGDANGDGEVNTMDLIRLMKYISGAEVDVAEGAGDVNGDGKVNTMDLIRLMKYINGEDVELN